jgi:uncharacterized protein
MRPPAGVDCLVIERTEPVRTCVGCRSRAGKSDLVRFVVEQGTCVPDPHGGRPGRGAWLHLDPDCFALAERRRAFPRALRSEGALDLAPVRALVKTASSNE